jgi:hypothetical protein
MCDNRRLIFFGLLLLISNCVSQKPVEVKNQGRTYFEDLAYIRSEEVKLIDNSEKDDTTNYKDINDISQDLDSVISIIKIESQNIEYVDGFTIQLYLGGDRTMAEETEEKINEIDSIIYRKTIFTQPNYRVKVGNYHNRFLVNKEFKRFKEKFPNAIIIPEKIKVN